MSTGGADQRHRRARTGTGPPSRRRLPRTPKRGGPGDVASLSPPYRDLTERCFQVEIDLPAGRGGGERPPDVHLEPVVRLPEQVNLACARFGVYPYRDVPRHQDPNAARHIRRGDWD